MAERSWRARRIDKRDHFLLYTNPRALRMQGYRMGPRRMRRYARVNGELYRHVCMVLKQMG